MGVAAFGQCFPDAAAAAASACASYPVASTDGATVCTGTSGAVLLLEKRGSSAVSFTVEVAGPPCSPATFAAAPFYVSPVDAALLASAVATCLGLGMALRALRNALSDRDLG